MNNKILKAFNALRYRSEIYRYATYVLLSMIVGIFSGLGSVLFHVLLDEMRMLFEPGTMSRLLSIDGRYIVLVPVAGGLVTASLTMAFPGIAAKKGVTSVIKSILIKNGFIPLKETLFHLAAPILSIGTGIPLGPEGPAAKIGSGIGSLMSQAFRLSPNDMKMYTAAGAGAAIAATFNAPIAGVFFGIEVILLNDMRNRLLGAFIIASVVASLVSRAILGGAGIFTIPKYAQPVLANYPLFIVLGIACGLVSLLYFSLSRAGRYLIEKKLKVRNPFLKLLPLCIVFGIVLLYFSELFGLGYNTINRAINGQFTAATLAVLLALKVLFVALFLRAGAYGGIFAPALSIGAFTGLLFSAAANQIFNLETDPVVFALASMGGVLAGMNSIPLTSIMLVMELTNDYRIVPPLMLVSVISYLSVMYMNRSSVYMMELQEEGINVSRYAEHNLLSRIRVADLKMNDFDAVPNTMPFRELVPHLIDSNFNDIFVVDSQNRLEGLISMRDMKQALIDSEMADLMLAMDVSSPAPYVTAEDTVSAAIMQLENYDIENIPVVDSGESRKIIGMITRHEILKAYNRLLESDSKIKL